MEIYAVLYHKVEVDPVDVIEGLIKEFFGDSHRWIKEKDGKWFIMKDESAGTHSFETEVREINEHEKEYFDALIIVENNLKIQRTQRILDEP